MCHLGSVVGQPVGLAVLAIGLLSPLAGWSEVGQPDLWTVEDLVLAESSAGWNLCPDGSVAVWVKRSVENVGDEEKEVSRLWLSRLDDGTRVQLTRGQESVSSPAFSPDWLRPARPGTDHDPVFDFDGNAAEWSTGEDGEGQAIGPSADRSSVTEPPDPAYIGFRVMVDQ